MRKKRKNSAKVFTQLLTSLKNILEEKPPFAKMKEEVEMMGFFIRPIEGDPQIIEKIDDQEFIEALWTIGKIDSLLEKNFHYLNKNQKQIILEALNKIQERLILKAKIKREMVDELSEKTPSHLMLEIYRKRIVKKNIN